MNFFIHAEYFGDDVEKNQRDHFLNNMLGLHCERLVKIKNELTLLYFNPTIANAYEFHPIVGHHVILISFYNHLIYGIPLFGFICTKIEFMVLI